MLMMRICVYAAMTSLALVGMAATQADVNQVDRELPLLTSPLIELGEVVAGSTIETTLYVVNPSDQPVAVKDTRASCGCTTLGHDGAFRVGAGGFMEIPLTINVPEKPGTSKDAGVSVVLDDRNAMKTSITMDIVSAASETSDRPDVVVVPRLLDLGDVPTESRHERFVWVINPGDEAVEVSGVKAGCGCTTFAGFEPVALAPGAMVRVPLAFQAKKKAGPVRDITMHVMSGGERIGAGMVRVRTVDDATEAVAAGVMR